MSKSKRDASEDRRLGGATRGGKHADRGGKGDTSRTASDKAGKTRHIGRPPAGKHRKGD